MKKTTTKTTKSVKVKPVKKVTTKAKATKKPKTSKIEAGNMDDFQQCVVLAAIINQQREANPDFQLLPLPEINSTLLAPLREQLAQYAFTASDIKKAAAELLHSKEFKLSFPAKLSTKKDVLNITGEKEKDIMNELLQLAGPESHKPLYLTEKGPHDIHKTTLEKHALKTGQIDPHPLAAESQNKPGHESTHKQIIIKLNFSKMDRDFSNSQKFSTKQRRGRG